MGEMSNRADTSAGDETIQTRETRKRKGCEGSSSELLDEREDESNVPKKKRFIWTNEMHRKFVDAIAQIGEDRAFPKRIVYVMNEPGLTMKNVASHLQKYRICLKKSQEERERYFQGFNAATENSKTPYMYNYSLGNHQQHYLGTSQLASNNYLPTSTSIHSSLYGLSTGIGASSVRLAPPSYSCFDVSSLPAVNTGNMHNQYSRRTEANTSFGDYGGTEEGNILSSTFIERSCSRRSDDHATSSSTSKSAFMGFQFANDGRSPLFGGANRSDIVSTGSYSSKRNDFEHHESAAPIFPSFDTESHAQNSPLPPLPEFEDHLEEPSLPPLPEENEFINFIPRQETNFGTSLTEGMNSFSSGHTGTSLDQQNSLELLASEILENIEQEQIFTTNHAVTSLPPTTFPWNPNTNMASNPLINQEDSLPPLPSEVPSAIPWNIDSDLVPQPYTGNFFDEQNAISDQIIEASFQNPSSFHDNMW